MTAPFSHVLTDEEQLLGRQAAPSAAVLLKKITRVDPGAASLIAASPLVLVATADARGRATVSPRGGPPGFVRVLDERRLAIVDKPGNRLVDSSRNVLANPHVGLLFVVPGRSWTLRVDGRAWLTQDPEALGEGPPGRLALGVEVQQVFVHCGRAFDLGSVWEPGSWPADPPDAGAVFRGHVAEGSVQAAQPAARPSRQ